MWVRITYTKVRPDAVEETRALYESEEVSGRIRRQKGYRFNYLLQSTVDPTDAISLTAWETRSDGEAYEQSGAYAEILDMFKNQFAAPPRLETYESVTEVPVA